MLTAGPGLAGAGRVFCGCCASGSAGRTGPRDTGQAGKRAGPGKRPGALGLAGLGRAWGLLQKTEGINVIKLKLWGLTRKKTKPGWRVQF